MALSVSITNDKTRVRKFTRMKRNRTALHSSHKCALWYIYDYGLLSAIHKHFSETQQSYKAQSQAIYIVQFQSNLTIYEEVF